MKNQIKKWLLRVMATGILIVVLLVGIVLNPTTLYSKKTELGIVIIYHNKALDKAILLRISEAGQLLRASELYDAEMQFDICLNDGSYYPSLIQMLQGNAFAWGFYNKVVLNGEANFTANYVALNGYKWNLSQLLAHEATHCLQANKFGVLGSNPIAGYPTWKWEGYPEYIARKNNSENIQESINRYTKSNSNEWGITLPDDTSVSREYYKYWLLVRYCIELKNLSYEALLKDTTSEETVMKEMGI